MILEVLCSPAKGEPRQIPLVFVHGAWHGAWCWGKHYLDYFSQNGFDCYALSLRGHGSSEGYENLNGVSLADYVNDVLQTIEMLHCKPILIGHSMGGAIVQKLIGDHQDKVSGAVLLASIVAGGYTEDILKEIPISEFSSDVQENITSGILPSPKEMTGLFFNDRLTTDLLENYTELLQEESDKVKAEMYTPFTDKYSNVKIPVFVIGSSSDKCIPKKSLKITADAYGVEAVVLPDMCHDMMLDPAWLYSAEKILDFLSQFNDGNKPKNDLI
jgi:Predicted hydrolases or acyltransferases (alpha/beta hydrolase superfamily)